MSPSPKKEKARKGRLCKARTRTKKKQSFGDMKIVNWRHGGKIMRDRSTIGDMAGREKELNAGHEPFSQKKKKQGRGGFARPGQGQKKNKVLAT